MRRAYVLNVLEMQASLLQVTGLLVKQIVQFYSKRSYYLQKTINKRLTRFHLGKTETYKNNNSFSRDMPKCWFSTYLGSGLV